MNPNDAIEWSPDRLADVPSWALQLELHLRRGPKLYCYSCKALVDEPRPAWPNRCPECKVEGFLTGGNGAPDHASPAYLAWRVRTVAKHLPESTSIDKLFALLKEAGTVPKIGLEQQGHIETVRQMRRDGKTWDEINAAIGWSGNAAREEWETMGYGWTISPFERTGVPVVDLILLATSFAAWKYRPEEWGVRHDLLQNPPHLEGRSPAAWIQNAANKAAAAYRDLLKPRARR